MAQKTVLPIYACVNYDAVCVSYLAVTAYQYENYAYPHCIGFGTLAAFVAVPVHMLYFTSSDSTFHRATLTLLKPAARTSHTYVGDVYVTRELCRLA